MSLRISAGLLLVAVAAQAALAQRPPKLSADNSHALIARIPLAADAGSSLFVSVRVNGSAPGWWVLDSGASECIVDRSIARQMKLTVRGGRDVHGAGKGTVRLDSIRGGLSLRLAGRTLAICDHFGALDLNAASSGVGRTIAGILGHEFFERYVVKIDFTAHELTLYDPVKYRYTGNGDTLALEFARKLPYVNVRIRTARRPEITRRLLVDTGSDDFVDDQSVRRSANGPTITVSTTGLGKSYEAVIGTLDTVWIGKSMFTKVPGVAADIGLVGNGIWSKFICVFDYSRRRLFVERVPAVE